MGSNAILAVRVTNASTLAQLVPASWRAARSDEAIIGASHFWHTPWRYFGDGYERGPWPQIRAAIVRLRALGPVWYLSEAVSHPRDLFLFEVPTPEQLHEAISEVFHPITEDELEEIDWRWMRSHPRDPRDGPDLAIAALDRELRRAGGDDAAAPKQPSCLCACRCAGCAQAHPARAPLRAGEVLWMRHMIREARTRTVPCLCGCWACSAHDLKSLAPLR